jgi:hypothetical protein
MRVDRIVRRMSLTKRAANTRTILRQFSELDRIRQYEFIRGASMAQQAIVNAAQHLSYDVA